MSKAGTGDGICPFLNAMWIMSTLSKKNWNDRCETEEKQRMPTPSHLTIFNVLYLWLH